MNELRVILLLFGAIAVAAIYFWDAIRQRRELRRTTTLPDTDPLDPVVVAREDEPEIRSLPREPAAPRDDRIILLHVEAAPGRTFNGRDILDATREAGLHYGPMKIFHYFGVPGSRNSVPEFSVANILEPGAFDLDNMDAFVTCGVTLFLRTAMVRDPAAAFDRMLDVAEVLAESLGGQLRAADHSPLDEQQIAVLRAGLPRVEPAP